MRSMLPSNLSPYDILGIDKSASTEDVRRAYRRKALETHPDKLDAKAKQEEKLYTEDQFRKVCDAFEILGDPQKRQAYDSSRKLQSWNNLTRSEELDRRMKERQEWARKQADSIKSQSTTRESDPSKQWTQKQEEELNYSKKTIESDRLKLLLKERQEWAHKQQEEHRKRMESIREHPQPQDLPHQELVTKLVNEMAEALNDAIPGWLERKRKAEQINAEQSLKAELASRK